MGLSVVHLGGRVRVEAEFELGGGSAALVLKLNFHWIDTQLRVSMFLLCQQGHSQD